MTLGKLTTLATPLWRLFLHCPQQSLRMKFLNAILLGRTFLTNYQNNGNFECTSKELNAFRYNFRPELYGKDLVAHLSKILNECTSSYNAIAASLAIEGIRHLCKAEIIDVVTTWATLSPKFKSDNRTPVIKRLIT